MNKLKLLSLVSVLTACTNLSADNLMQKFFSDYFTGLETHNITNYENAELDYDLTSSTNKNIHFTNCKQVDEIRIKTF